MQIMHRHIILTLLTVLVEAGYTTRNCNFLQVIIHKPSQPHKGWPSRFNPHPQGASPPYPILERGPLESLHNGI